MKKISIIIFILSAITFNSQAKIWRVSNVSGVVADFTTAQLAHNGAAAGDTIHLEPSPTSYGALTTSKRLVWLSTGNFIAWHAGLQYSTNLGSVDYLAVNAGSQNSVFSCNADYVNCYAANVTFQRCYISSNYLNINSGGNNCVVTGCYINGYMGVNNSSNVVISNNIIRNFITVPSGSSAIITNNVINSGNSSASSIYNSLLQNNIFNQATNNYTFITCVLNNNMANNNTLPNSNGNLNNVVMSTVFTTFNGNVDTDLTLKVGSPAIGAGYGGVDMGAFGGSSPFVVALQPAIPAIYQLTAPAAPSGNTMNVTFSTKSNN